jgi:hypothetical protein
LHFEEIVFFVMRFSSIPSFVSFRVFVVEV